jgi:hypothetical protein
MAYWFIWNNLVDKSPNEVHLNCQGDSRQNPVELSNNDPEGKYHSYLIIMMFFVIYFIYLFILKLLVYWRSQTDLFLIFQVVDTPKEDWSPSRSYELIFRDYQNWLSTYTEVQLCKS